jgi:dynein heavy chain
VYLQVRSDLNNDTRRKVNTLIITDVHARDIIDKFVRDSIMDAREFAWESQLRFYWDKALVSAQLCARGRIVMAGNSR